MYFKCFLKVFIFSSFCIVSYAQRNQQASDFYTNWRQVDQSLIKYDESAIGSPYFPENYTKAKLSYLGNDSILMMRFDSFTNDMEISVKDGAPVRLKPMTSLMVKFLKEGKTFDSHLIPQDGKAPKMTFVEVVASLEDKKLVADYTTTYTPAKLAETPFERDVSSEYKLEPTNYYFVMDNYLREVPKRKKQLLEKFDNELPKLKSFLKKNKIQLNNREGLKEFFNYWATNKN